MMKLRMLLIILCIWCAPLATLAQTSATDTLFPPNDSVPNDTVPNDTIPNDSIPNDTLPPGAPVAFQSRIGTIDYAAGVVTFQTMPFIAKTTTQTRFRNGTADTVRLTSFVVDQMVLVAGFYSAADTVLVDSMVALNFLPTDTSYVPQQVVVRLAPDESLADINADPLLSTVDSIPELRMYLLQAVTSGAAIDSLALKFMGSPSVEQVDANYLIGSPEGVQSSQPFIDLQARGDFGGQIATRQTNLSEAQQISTGDSVKVGLLDGGIDRSHPLFINQTITGYDFLRGTDAPDDVPGGPGYGHGTFIAGLVKLIAPAAQLRIYRVLDSTGRGNGFLVAKAIVRAVKDSCRVLNLSMVMRQPHFAIELAIRYAWQANVTVVAAAGNDSSDVALYPASDEHVIAVAGVDSTNRKEFFSSFGSHIDVCAPGAWVYAPYPTDKYAWWNGTSFAAPFVTGQVALLEAHFPHATVSDIARAVKVTARSVDASNPGLEGLLGAGLVDLAGSLRNFPQFQCGDIDASGFGPDLADLALLIAFLTGNRVGLPDPSLANINGSEDNRVDLSDLSLLISYLTGSGPGLRCR